MTHKATIKALAKTIRSQREFLGMTRSELSDASGISYQAVCKLEQGSNITTYTMLSICEGLELAPADLWDLVDEEISKNSEPK